MDETTIDSKLQAAYLAGERQVDALTSLGKRGTSPLIEANARLAEQIKILGHTIDEVEQRLNSVLQPALPMPGGLTEADEARPPRSDQVIFCEEQAAVIYRLNDRLNDMMRRLDT